MTHTLEKGYNHNFMHLFYFTKRNLKRSLKPATMTPHDEALLNYTIPEGWYHFVPFTGTSLYQIHENERETGTLIFGSLSFKKLLL